MISDYLVIGPVPSGENSGQNEFSEAGDEVDWPVQREEVEPLKAEGQAGLFVASELALNDWTTFASLKQ